MAYFRRANPLCRRLTRKKLRQIATQARSKDEKAGMGALSARFRAHSDQMRRFRGQLHNCAPRNLIEVKEIAFFQSYIA
ncbi:MAG: hypothetical protein JJT95_17525 [Pararhodobacter sp.]|nr:hypothetical protein [Pararhodobacter sp.]